MSLLYRYFIDLRMVDWPEEVDSDGNLSRIIQYNLSITFSLGTKLSYTTEKQVGQLTIHG